MENTGNGWRKIMRRDKLKKNLRREIMRTDKIIMKSEEINKTKKKNIQKWPKVASLF